MTILFKFLTSSKFWVFGGFCFSVFACGYFSVGIACLIWGFSDSEAVYMFICICTCLYAVSKYIHEIKDGDFLVMRNWKFSKLDYMGLCICICESVYAADMKRWSILGHFYLR